MSNHKKLDFNTIKFTLGFDSLTLEQMNNLRVVMRTAEEDIETFVGENDFEHNQRVIEKFVKLLAEGYLRRVKHIES